jgi:hypothetical protein
MFSLIVEKTFVKTEQQLLQFFLKSLATTASLELLHFFARIGSLGKYAKFCTSQTFEIQTFAEPPVLRENSEGMASPQNIIYNCVQTQTDWLILARLVRKIYATFTP